jgi:hypothetical protein
LNGPYIWVLLSAMGLNDDNGLFLVTYVVVECDNNDTWWWFLYVLYGSIQHGMHHKPYFIIFEKQKVTFILNKQNIHCIICCLFNYYNFLFIQSLLEAVFEVFSNATHRHCARHIYTNIKTKGFHGLEINIGFGSASQLYTILNFISTWEMLGKLIMRV